MSTRTFEWGSHHVHIDDEGSNRAGDPVVLVHSSGFSGRQWRRLAELLSSKELRPVVPDLLGSGRSTPWPPGEPFAFSVDVDLVSAIIEELGRPVHLVGHSYGGLLALRAALRSPALVKTLSLYDPVVFGALDERRDADAVADLVLLRFVPHPSSSELPAWLQSFVDYWNGPGAWERLGEPTRAELLRVGWVVHEGARTLVADRTPASAYAGLHVPTLLVGGETSPLAARRVATRLEEAMPNASIEIIAGAGHMGPLTHTALVNTKIAAHILAHLAQGVG